MRELAIGDIHGCARAFQTLLHALDLQPTDTLVLLGDYIDRGPGSCEVIETILELKSTCRLITLSGNHEKMLLWARSDRKALAEWLIHGGEATLDSYRRQGYAREVGAIPERHLRFFQEQTLAYWETGTHIFVHASLDPALELAAQPDFLLYWQYFADPTIHQSGKQIVCGHTSQRSGLPARFRGGICIDTWAHGGGWLTCLDTHTQMATQANEKGELRTLTLRS